ncbi:MAG: hypothetical protein KY475_04360 [Planctomycetes bacterium]|nr:hypothetical protein [Planctomycetota bacterium]
MQYLLPCECGRRVPVATSQAGETVVCECGRSLTAPKLRELRQLEPHAVKETAPRRPVWSFRQGVMFVAGIVVLLISIVTLVITGMQRSSLYTEKPEFHPEFIEQQLAQIDRNSPVENLELWRHEILEHGLTRPGDPGYLLHRRAKRALTIRLIVFGVIAAAGAGLIAGAFLVRPREPRPA